MAAANSPPPWVSLYLTVDLAGLPVEEVEEWGEIRCPRRKAYGCGDDGQKLVEGLTLLARYINRPNLTTYLRIRLNDQAVQIIQAEFGMGGKPLVKIGYGGLDARGAVHHADDDGLIVLALYFSVGYLDDHIYYLVYDASDAGSLTMIRHVEPYCISSLSPTALPVRCEDGVHLLLLARLLRPEFEEQGLLRNDVLLCSCPPPSSTPAGANMGPWQLQKLRFGEEAPELFSRHIAFSFKGQAFWGDLTLGIACCVFGEGSQAHFDFIPLPEKFQLDSETLKVPMTNHADPMEFPVTMVRTMGHLGGSLAFVSIDHSGAPTERMVTVLTHDLGRRRRHLGWTKAAEFSVSSLWNLKCFRRAGLPHQDPNCPVLRPDGTLCFLLPSKGKMTEDGSLRLDDDHVCILDLYCMNILAVGRVRNYRAAGPIFVPHSFIKSLNPLAPSNR